LPVGKSPVKKKFQLWEKIFEVKGFDLARDSHFITADEIKAITGAEPRVMAKIDAAADLPDVFRRNGYFILPVKNGRYAIVRGEGFHPLEPVGTPAEKHVSRVRFHLTTAARGAGEMQYLDYSFYSGAIEKIIGKSPLYQSIRGREYSRAFQFRVNRTPLRAASVQFEVDSGLEGKDSIVLIEAKIKTPVDFIVRQLFYPFRHFSLVSPDKQIIPVFFTYEPADMVYHFWIYEFTDPSDYNSIRLKEARSLKILIRKEFELHDIKSRGIARKKDLIPQANDLNKVIELVFKVNEGVDNYRSIAGHFHFNERQSSYYREAAEALGLICSLDNKYRLTDTGKELVSLPAEQRNRFMVDLLSDFDLIKEGLGILQAKNKLTAPDLERIISRRRKLSGTTVSRRAGSLSAWFKWIAETTGSISHAAGIFTR
jgi:hypothetical protein